MIHPHTPMNGQARAFTDAVEARRDAAAVARIGKVLALAQPSTRCEFCGMPSAGARFCAACKSILDEPSIGAPS